MSPFADPSQLVSQVLGRECNSPLQPYSRALARNLLADDRISDDRFGKFSAFAGNMADIRLVQHAIELYQLREVRPLVSAGVPPAYARPENAKNIVEEPPEYVATILNLTGLSSVYAEAWKTFGIPEFQKYEVTDQRGSQQVNDFLSNRLTDPAQRESFLQATLRALRRYRNSKKIEQHIRPSWVAEWNSLRPFLDRNKPERWLQAAGVPSEDPAWLAVFRYRVRRRGKLIGLFRPTQLDAGWNAHHFPSPLEATGGGGHTMYLLQAGEVPPDPLGLISEYLHAQIDFSMADWRAAGGLLGMARRVGGDLDEQRRRHWLLLQEKYGQKQIVKWMAACP